MTSEIPQFKPAKIIIFDNKRAQLISNDLVLIKKVHSFLSYKLIGVEWTQAYQNGWNGITYLMNKKGFFASGLVSKVKEFLINNQYPFEEKDLRAPITLYPEIDLNVKLQSLKMVPRNYQEEIIQACLNNRKGIVRSCVGSGKTLTTALLTAKLNKPTILYIIGLDLLKQFHDLFSSLFDEPIGYIGNGVCDVQRINIASIWSIGRALKIDKKNIISDDELANDEQFNESQSDKIIKMLKETKLHIFDESHVVTTNTIDVIYKVIDPEHIYGFSGTPFKDDGSDKLIHGILGDQIINVSASRLIKAGWLAQPIIKFITVPKMGGIDLSSYLSVYRDYIVENQVRNSLIVNSVKTLLDKKYIPLVLFKQIKHGKILLEMMKNEDIKCEMLYGDDSLEKRTEVKEMLLKKEIDVILASVVFDIGVNIEELSALVLAGSGKSRLRANQRIGRVCRGNNGKKKFCAVVDFFDQTRHLKKHSMIRCETYLSEEGFKVIKCQVMK
jgi:superfamily II DNA or RNA helicase